MNSEKEAVKRIIAKVLPKYGVKKAALFGSMVKGKFTKKSDVDLLVEFEGKKSLFDLLDLKFELEKQLKKEVDVVTYKSLHPLLRDKILSEQEAIL
ncbi:MAG: nucleotidyltransferase family protein [Candidatus Diapherotrites archaeon]